jgi:hypothetical protein
MARVNLGAHVDDDDVTVLQYWAETLLKIGEKHLCGHSSRKGHWRSHFVAPHRSDEGDCLPRSKGNAADY